MAFVVTVVAGTVLAVNTLVDNPTLNLLGQPTVTVTGNLADLANVSSTAATVNGQPLVWNTGTSKWEPASTIVARQYLEAMTGASASVNGASGAVPQPLAGQDQRFLRGDGTWQSPNQAPGNDLFASGQFI